MTHEPAKIELYRIRRIKDGLFSEGGISPKFSQSGKTWKRIGDLKNHLTFLQGYFSSWPYDDCLIEKRVFQELYYTEQDLEDIYPRKK